MVKFIETDIRAEDLLERLKRKGCRFILSGGKEKELIVYGKLTDEEKEQVELLELEIKKLLEQGGYNILA